MQKLAISFYRPTECCILITNRAVFRISRHGNRQSLSVVKLNDSITSSATDPSPRAEAGMAIAEHLEKLRGEHGADKLQRRLPCDIASVTTPLQSRRENSS